MTIDVSEQLAVRLRQLARQQGQDLNSLVEEALRRYLDDASITDLEPADVAATQENLVSELGKLSPWPDPPESAHDAPE